jgi:hypothetical protein
MTVTSDRACGTAPTAYTLSKERQRREAWRGLGVDPDTGERLARPAPLEAATRLGELVADDAEFVSHRDRVKLLAALTSLAQAESESRSAAALESIAASLAHIARARTPETVNP